MALQPTEMTVPLFGGLELKIDPKYVDPTKSLTAQNIRYPAVERAEARYGQSVLSNYVEASDAYITTGKAIGSFGNEILTYDGTSLYAFSPTNNFYVNRANLTEIQTSVQNITAGINSVNDMSSAALNGIEFYVWSDTNGNVYYSSRDSVSGTFFAQNIQLQASAGSPCATAGGGYFYALVISAAGVLTLYQFATGNATAPLSQTLVGYAVAGSNPAMRYTTQGTLLIAYVSSAGNLTLASYTGGTLSFIGAQTTAVANLASGARLAVATGLISGNYYAAAATQPLTSTTGTLVFCNKTMASAATATVMPGPTGVTAGYFTNIVGIEVAQTTAGNSLLFAVGNCSYTTGTTKGFNYFVATENNISTPLTISAPIYSIYLASQVVATGNQFYWISASSPSTIAGYTSQQWSYLLQSQPFAAIDVAANISLTPAAPQILQRYYGSQAFTGPGNPVNFTVLSNGNLFAGQAYRASLREDANGTIFTSSYVAATTFSFPAVSGLQVQQFNNIALINCGSTYSYDGFSVVEQGFWEFPEGVSAVANGTGTGSLNNLGVSPASYQVFCTYEWTDAVGNITYSAPSYPAYVNCAQNDSVTVTFPFTNLTRKQNVVIGVYITNVNASSPAYKVGTVPNLTGGAVSATFTITTSDLVNSGGQRLYAPADFTGELENEPAPPFKYIFATKTRVFGIPQDAPYQLWYSKPMAPGRPAEFAAEQYIVIEQQGGAVTGLSALDTQAVVFKSGRLYTLPGDGPNAGGQPANAFPQTLQLVSTTTGCISNASILATSDGLFFQSQVGLTQLNRSVTVDATFGLSVQPLVQSLSITGAQAVPAQNQLRWVSSNGPAVVFDYATQRWSTYSNYDAVGYAPYGSTYARLRADGRVWYEDTSRYDDNGTGVQIILETSWLKPSQMAQGFAAVWYATILGDYAGAHTLTIETAYDYLTAPSDTVTWNATTNGTLGTYGSDSPYGLNYFGTNSTTQTWGTHYQVRYAVKRQVCEAIKFRIYATGSAVSSCALNEITLQLGIIDGIKRLPVGQQV